MITEIKNINDVKVFANYLVEVENLSFHPDDDFNDYITSEQKPFYSKSEAELRNKLMNDCFKVCNKNNLDIYEIILPIIQQPVGIL
ncbi:hypothetical protein AAH994_05920 [Weeksellaceae bacterium A-14]